MALRDLATAKDTLETALSLLESIDFDTPSEPLYGEIDDWRNYAKSLIDIIGYAEINVNKAIREIES